jgi:hypothetical protein
MEKESKKVYEYKTFTFKIKKEVYNKKLITLARERGQTVSGMFKRELELALKIKLNYK